MVAEPLANLAQESQRLLDAAAASGIGIRLTGGLAVWRRCPSARQPPLSRDYADLDLIITSKTEPRGMTEFMQGLGYRSNERFNTLHSDSRLYYLDMPNSRHVDVFIDTFRMCHTLDLRGRILLLPDTLPPADLLLTKLQIVQLNRKDIVDMLALLMDHEIRPSAADAIDPTYLETMWSGDWPLWRTCRDSLIKVKETAPALLSGESLNRVQASLDEVMRVHADGKRTLAWRIRARVGERIQWYELPEEVG